uniref:Uncharacterized protein n=1 Tax=Octopus bimaculoides TaxID=37653 RepID=A0A0L8IDS7_OCTBM
MKVCEKRLRELAYMKSCEALYQEAVMRQLLQVCYTWPWKLVDIACRSCAKLVRGSTLINLVCRLAPLGPSYQFSTKSSKITTISKEITDMDAKGEFLESSMLIPSGR